MRWSATVRGAAGSSPLARGLLGDLLGPLAGERIIPARAGFTRCPPWPPCSRPDHPRSRGVYWWPRRPPSATTGSSPLARGLPPTTKKGGRPNRIIPARAGFTSTSPRTSKGAADHPRSRGVYSTPSREETRTQDHPRSRGVYASITGTKRLVMGSSPLARGLRRFSIGTRSTIGIIPARAGFTIQMTCSSAISPDHPRSRGVYVQGRSGLASRGGSSPLARGLRSRDLGRQGLDRIIPARAGFTGG